MKPIEGSKILVFGQETIIIQVMKYKNKYRYYLDRDIEINSSNDTKDYVDDSEIQKIIEI
jgi:hypothetical protein